MPETYDYEYFNVTFPAEHVAHVEIAREEKLNAFIEVMWLNLAKIFDRLSRDPDVRAVVLSGKGEKAFTAGLDVQAASRGGALGPEGDTLDGARRATALRRHIVEFQDCITSVEKCEKPVIAVLHGFSYGLAIDLSLAADVRLCTTAARCAVKEVDIGLAADVGTLSRLPRAVASASWAKEVCLTAREFGGEEAVRVGFASGGGAFADKRAALERAVEMARLVASKSPVAAQGTKALLNWSRDHSVQDGLAYTAVWNSAMLQTRDVKDAMLSGMQKRTPRFEKL